MENNSLAIPFVKILGCRVHLVSLSQVADRIGQWVEGKDGLCHQVIVTGFHGLWEAKKNREFRAMLNSADLWVPDGIAPVWIARFHGLRAQRTPGADIMRAFFERANEKGYKSFFYGDTDDTIVKLRAALEEKYPGHRVVGAYSPPFRPLTPEEDEAIVKTINEAAPDVLWVGLGMPKQDRWIYERLGRLKVPVAIGVGAAFQFLAGKVKRSPDWVGSAGLEWLWRLALEPRKLWRRDLLDGPRFIACVLMELAGLRKYE